MKNLRNVFICTILAFYLLCPGIIFANGSLSNPNGYPGIPSPFLKERSATLVVEDGLGMMEIEDVFVNPHHSRIEGIYRFSLPEGAFVSSFAYMVDDKNWVDGKIMELNKARLVYSEIVRRQTDPGLLEQSGNDLLIKIFPVLATAPVHIRFRMHFPVFTSENSLECELPISPDSLATIENDGMPGFDSRPKGFPGSNFPGMNSHDDPSKNMASKSPPLVKLSGVCRDSRGLKAGSLNPAGTCRDENGEMILKLESFDLQGKKVILKIPLKESGKPSVSSFRDNSGKRFWVARVPGIPLKETFSPNPAIIVDSSGSMGGKNISRIEKILDLLDTQKVVRENLFCLAESGLKPVNRADINKIRFFGPVNWDISRESFNGAGITKAFDSLFLLTDGEELTRSALLKLQTAFGKKPVRVVLVNGEFPASLRNFPGTSIQFVQFFNTDDFALLEKKLPGMLNELGAGLKAQLPDGTTTFPIWGSLSSNSSDEAHFVNLSETAPSMKIVDGKNGLLLDLSDPGEKTARQARGQFLLLPAKQRIVTLQRQEQTPQVIAEITRLGLENNLVTDYTAFLAVPEDIAAKFGEILNPAYLAAFATPNFKKARESARIKSCYANMRVILGSIEMYNMDYKEPFPVDPVTCEIDMKKLVEGGYLKSIPECPSGKGTYRFGPGNTLSGNPFCLLHGYVDMEKKTLEDEFLARCEKLGLEPVDFDLDFSRFSGPMNEVPSPLKKWIQEMKSLLWFIELFI